MQLELLGPAVRDIVKGESLMVVTDENVAPLYLHRCIQSLQKEGFDVYSFVIPPGEESKSGEMYLRLVNELASIPLTRADALVALGGGVVGDLTGFAAATFLRGIKVIQVPTTLLAAVDSSVGGKTAINLPAGKNLAGAFHQPALIWCDASLLETLPAEIYQDGMAEVIKYGVIADADLFALLGNKAFAQSHVDDIINRCVSIKNRFVEEDEHDTGVRQLLNFGHTIGHAIEIASDFTISHGLAVAKGMAYMAEIAAKKNWCDGSTRDRIIDLLNQYEFDLSVNFEKEVLCDIMKKDKKRKGNVLDLVVPESIGTCVLKRITIGELQELL